jgi:creatinase
MTITENLTRHGNAVNDVAKLERLKVLNNGEKVALTFSDTEFERRLAGLRSIMAEKDLDAVVLTSYHSIKYYSDFLFTYFGRSYAMVVTKEDTVTVTANIDAGMPWRRSYGENLVYTDWRRDNYIFGIQEVLRTRGINVRRLGVEDDSLPLDNRNKIQAAFSGATLVDVAQAAMRQRMIKSAEEIEVIKHGARIGDLGGEAIRNAITAGITEYEVALIGTEAMVHEIARTFPNSEIRDTWVWFQSGINTDGAHNWATTRKIQEHDILSLNCFPMTSGYYTALERTLFFGEPDARSLELWNINVEVHKPRPGTHQARRRLQGHRRRAQRDLRVPRPARQPHLRLRPLLRRPQPLLRPRSRARAARGHRHRARTGHGGLHGTDDHGP